MRYRLIILIGILSVIVGQPTEVSGIISSNTTWSAASSPYIVTSGVLVNEGVTLTIQPGTEVRFDEGVSLLVNGELIAQGTDGDEIIFTSNQFNPAAGDWGSLLFHDSSQDAVFNEDGTYFSGSIIEHCIIEYGNGVKLSLGNPFINYSSIRNNEEYGININSDDESNVGSVLKISNSIISYNKKGINIYGRGKYIINNNEISDNSTGNGGNDDLNYGAGIRASYGDQINISNNIFRSNTAGYMGGGFFGTANLYNNKFIGNNAVYAGAIYTWGGSVVGNTLYDNTVSEFGGAIYINHNNADSVYYNKVINNYASRSGGGIYSIESGAIISNNVIATNSTGESGPMYGKGGGVYVGGELDNSSTLITFNQIINNTSYISGAGIYVTCNGSLVGNNTLF